MVFVPPRSYVVIDNPVKKTVDPKTGEEVVVCLYPIRTFTVQEFEPTGQVKLRHGDQEIRFSQDPFPLYEGESCGPVQPLQVVQENTALVLRAKRSFFDNYGKVERRAGEQWLFKGPQTYYPQVEVEVVRTQLAFILKPDQAIQLQATLDCVDYENKHRKVGEKWLVTGKGAYLPSLTEQFVTTVKASTLTDTKAIHVQASASCTDALGVHRTAGEEWLVTKEDTKTYIPGIHEKITNSVNLTILTSRQYCIIRDPINDSTGEPQLGKTKVVKGPKRFFLRPGESIESGIKNVEVLESTSAIWLEARQGYKDEDGVTHKPGEQWMVCGPTGLCLPSEVVVTSRIRSYLSMEPFGLYFFRPQYALLLLFIFGLYLFNKMITYAFSGSTDSGVIEEVVAPVGASEL